LVVLPLLAPRAIAVKATGACLMVVLPLLARARTARCFAARMRRADNLKKRPRRVLCCGDGEQRAERVEGSACALEEVARARRSARLSLGVVYLSDELL
jgi:hypothetical protein